MTGNHRGLVLTNLVPSLLPLRLPVQPTYMMLLNLFIAMVFGLMHVAPSLAVDWPGSQDSTSCLVECLTLHGVPYVTSSSSVWTVFAATFNVRLQYEPAAIALPSTTEHVSHAVMCAKESGIKVQPKSGGHSYASFSTGGVNGILEIDLENFNTITLDNSTNLVSVGGGVRLGNLALEIYNRNERAMAHGTCPGVGVGGHATHGGYGCKSRLPSGESRVGGVHFNFSADSSRAWGLALDQIVALDVVLANGSCVHATDTSYPDVYYVRSPMLDVSSP